MVWKHTNGTVSKQPQHFFQEMLLFMKLSFISIILLFSFPCQNPMIFFQRDPIIFPAQSHQYLDTLFPNSASTPTYTHVTSPSAHSSTSNISNEGDSLVCTPTEMSFSPHIIHIRASTWTKRTPSYLQDYHCNLVSRVPVSQSGSMAKVSESGKWYPVLDNLDYNRLSTVQKNYILALSTMYEPQFYAKASKHLD